VVLNEMVLKGAIVSLYTVAPLLSYTILIEVLEYKELSYGY